MASAWLAGLEFTHFAGEVLKIGHPCPILSFEFCLTAKHRKNGTTAVHGGKAVKPNRQNVWCGARVLLYSVCISAKEGGSIKRCGSKIFWLKNGMDIIRGRVGY